MNDILAMLFDGGLAEHWPDAVLAALLALAVWLLQRWISAGDSRDQALDAEAKKQGDKIVSNSERLVRLETQIDIGRKIDRLTDTIQERWPRLRE